MIRNRTLFLATMMSLILATMTLAQEVRAQEWPNLAA